MPRPATELACPHCGSPGCCGCDLCCCDHPDHLTRWAAAGKAFADGCPACSPARFAG